MRIGVFSLGITIGFNVAVGLPAAKLWTFPAPHALLALSTGLAAFVNSALLFRGLRRTGVYRAGKGWKRLALQVLAANAAMAGLLWWLAGDLTQWLAWDSWTRVYRLAGLVLAGGALYFAVLALLGLRVRDLRRTL